MPDVLLHVGNDLAGISLIPAPIKVFGNRTQLDNEVCRTSPPAQSRRAFPSTAGSARVVITHDDPGIRTADEVAAVAGFAYATFHSAFSLPRNDVQSIQIDSKRQINAHINVNSTYSRIKSNIHKGR